MALQCLAVDARYGWLVAPCLRPLVKSPVNNVEEAACNPGPVWTDVDRRKNF